MIFRSLKGMAAIAACALLVPSALAQSRSSSVVVGATNGEYRTEDGQQFLYTMDSAFSGTGDVVTASASQSFTGMDSAGDQRTMDFSGYSRAESQYGRSRVYSDAFIDNAYYNFGNDPFYRSDTDEHNPDGVPSEFAAFGFANYTDQLQFGGQLAPQYTARYTFFVSGFVEYGNVYTYLYAQMGSNPTESFSITGRTGAIGEYFTTSSVPIDGTNPQTIDVSFTVQALLNTYSAVDGESIYGVGNFSSTATLVGIQVYDANDNPVDGWTVSSLSGTTYPVPEPTTMSILGLGLAAAIRRRKNARKS